MTTICTDWQHDLLKNTAAGCPTCRVYMGLHEHQAVAPAEPSPTEGTQGIDSTKVIPVLGTEAKSDERLAIPSEAKAKLMTEARTGIANIPTGTTLPATPQTARPWKYCAKHDCHRDPCPYCAATPQTTQLPELRDRIAFELVRDYGDESAEQVAARVCIVVDAHVRECERQLAALQVSHDRLRTALLRYYASHADDCGPHCRSNCRECQARAALVATEKLTGRKG